METHLHENAAIYDSASGAFISSRHQTLAQVLHDYNPYFSLVWIPPKDRDATDTKPFAILDSSPGRAPYIIRYLSNDEMDNTTEILAWVFEGDLTKHRPSDVFSRMESRRVAEEALSLKKREEELEDILEFGKYTFSDRSPNYMKHNGIAYRK